MRPPERASAIESSTPLSSPYFRGEIVLGNDLVSASVKPRVGAT
jgi:hypothetical protein